LVEDTFGLDIDYLENLKEILECLPRRVGRGEFTLLS
jgi:hypothetical protein